MKRVIGISTFMAGVTLAAQLAYAQPAEPARNPDLDPKVQAFLSQVNKNASPFWELPQPQPEDVLTSLQNQTKVDMSGVTTTSRTITQDGRRVTIHIMKPDHVAGKPGALIFLHGGVWIMGNFENHQRLLRDLVVGSGQIGVFVDYTPLPTAKYPTQLEESYAVLNWVAEHGGEIGADGSRIAVAGNAVGGNMAAALCLMARDRKGPKISYQVLMVPATDASVDTASYHQFESGFFLSRAFMHYGWDLYAPDVATRDLPYVSPLRASDDELAGLPPALVVTAENDPLRDEGEAYAHRLMQAGVDVTAVRYAGTIHDFVALNALRGDAPTVAALGQITGNIRRHLAR